MKNFLFIVIAVVISLMINSISAFPSMTAQQARVRSEKNKAERWKNAKKRTMADCDSSIAKAVDEGHLEAECHSYYVDFLKGMIKHYTKLGYRAYLVTPTGMSRNISVHWEK
jgi:hypothetical protein